MMRISLCFIIAISLYAESLSADDDFNIYESDYYGHYINLAGLKPLTQTDGRVSLRMVWLRSFHDPVIITMSCWEECTVDTLVFDHQNPSNIDRYESHLGAEASRSFMKFADTIRSYEYIYGRCPPPSRGFCLSNDGSSSGIELMVGSSKTFMKVKSLGRYHESLKMFIHRVIKSANVDFDPIY